MTLEATVHVERDGFALDVAITAEVGEVLAVLGPNGSGKTTFLRAVAGLTRLTSGRVALGGRVLDDAANGQSVPAHQRRVGVVFQDYRLFPHLSTLDNVAFGPRCTGQRRADALAAARAELVRVGLADLAGRRPDSLSGGQAQRVALARALATRPELLLLDEPLAALDVTTRSEIRAELQRVVSDFAGPVVLVTHDPLDALILADQLVVIEDGRVVQSGAPSGVAQRPATRYVADLMGVSLFRGTAVGGVVRLADGSSISTADTALSGPALVSVRPSSVLVSRSAPGPASARNVWPRRVASMQLLGDRVRIAFDGPETLLADITTAALTDLALSTGDDVWVSVKATDVAAYPDPHTP